VSTAPAPAGTRLLDQPKAVFAVAFACVVSFMGIGLVDPILPALSDQLDASPSQVTLLFTSYLLVTAVAMLVTGWVSSRLGAKRTLVTGLLIIVVFAGLAGSSDTVGEIVGFRAGWGLGNALFIATSLAVIVASASGGFAGAIVLYEAALGLGIAAGPLVGGMLGDISWRGPFYGVSALMAIALIATVVLLEPTPKPATPTRLSAPLRALRHRGLLTMSVTALLYNWGFFTMLGYAPFPMELSAIQLGLVFFGWGLLVAFFSVIGAPRLQARFGTARSLYLALGLFAVDLLVIAVFTDTRWVLVAFFSVIGAPRLQARFGTARSLYLALGLFAVDLLVIAVFTGARWVLVAAVIVSGAFIGINNTLTTQAVMLVAPVERPVASAAYSFVRFLGGGLAPFVAGKLVDAFDIHVPFYVGAVAVLAGVAVLSTGGRMLRAADADLGGHGAPDVSGEVADEFGGAPDAVDAELQAVHAARR
jgi:MFS transporter, ACDE family, multidrug resistance protein